MSAATTPTGAPYLTVAECAAYLGLTPKAVYHLVERGQLPCARLGRRVLFVRRSVDATVRGLERVSHRDDTRRRAARPLESV